MSSFSQPPKPAAKEDEGEEISTEEATKQLTKNDSNIKKERQHDVRWEGVPVRFRRFRDRNVQGGFRIEAFSLMPIWLRDLWPTHEFDPCAIWEKEKEKEAQQQRESDAAAAAGTKKKSSGAQKKSAKPSRKDLIQSGNSAKLYQELEEKDLERLQNCSKKSERGMLLSLRMSTPYGRLYQMLEILKDAIDALDKKTAFDVLWAIEDLPVYQSATKEEAAAKEEEEEEKKAAKKDKKDKKDDKKDKKKDKKDDKKDSKKKVKRSKECQLVYDNKKPLKKVQKMRDEENLVFFQLQEMADRLPPLSKFTSGWRLDEWQKRVLREVDKRRSAVVCAPTSSGKTIISSYITVAGGAEGRILFVVPTEPLVWQVAALFHKLLKGQVGLCMDHMSFRPEADLRVIVGTPRALETTLSKLRGPVGEEALNKLDYALLQGGFTFDYAVYDEVHSLDGEEGAALQRLIRSVNCNFLALSATIGNGEEVLAWMNEVRQDHLADVAIIEADLSARGIDSPMLHQNSESVHLEDFNVRFINLQRYVWVNDSFQQLHPLSAVTLDMLQGEDGLQNVSLPFTPNDTIELWKALTALFPEDKIADIAPEPFFACYEGVNRITLQMAKDYEEALCRRLEVLAKDMPAETEQLLKKFYPDQVGPECSVHDAVMDMRAKDLCPAILFHLDSFMCLELFKELLRQLEVGQRLKYPNYLAELRQKAEEIAKIRAQTAKIRVNEKEQAEEAQSGMADMDMSDQFVDTAAPHPDFVLATPTNRISSVEFDDICGELASSSGKSELKNPGHPLLRALRRGFGIYINDDSFPKYRRVVQRLAQQGKLAVVFSDESLAYGVNMPFRTCCFTSDMGDLLNPLVAQQMMGRAGRRGLDTQGNLLYMNMKWDRIQYLMLGTIPAMEGRDPRYPTMALQPALSELAPAEPFPPRGHARGAVFSKYVDRRMARQIAGRTLKESIEGVTPSKSYYETSKEICHALGLLDEDGDLVGSRTLAVCVWELRETLPQSLALAFCLDKFMDFFVNKRPSDYGEAPSAQIEMCGLLLMILDRYPCPEGVTPLMELPYFTKSKEKLGHLEEWKESLAASQTRLNGLPDEDKMRLPMPMEEPLDSRIFQIVMANSFQQVGEIDAFTRTRMLARLRQLGGTLMIMHNVLMLEDPFDLLEVLLRKTFQRVKYILADAVKEDAKQEDETEGQQEGESAAEVVAKMVEEEKARKKLAKEAAMALAKAEAEAGVATGATS